MNEIIDFAKEIDILIAPIIEQRSPEWYQQRIGKVTASRVADMMRTTKSGYSTSRANYASELITERWTGMPADHYQNEAMRYGTETEPQARDAYAFYSGCDGVVEVGFVEHPSIPMSGASPDGLVGDDGLLECKCPFVRNRHTEVLIKKKIPEDHVTQMMWQMACTGRQWCDYVSFDPRFDEPHRLFVKRLMRDSMVIDRLEKEVLLFLKEVEATMKAIDG